MGRILPRSAFVRDGDLLHHQASIRSDEYHKTIARKSSAIEVLSLACPKFVSIVESNEINSSVAKKIVYESMAPLVDRVDTLVLGCTHYPLLRPIIQNVMGLSVKLIDSGAETVRDVSVLLNYFEINRSREVKDKTEEYYTTASVLGFKEIAEQWLGEEVTVQHVDLDKELEND